MARVSLAGAKQLGIALAWILLFAVVGGLVTVGISAAVPGWGGQRWFVVRTGLCEVIGFGVATWLVGRQLNKQSWQRMGWGKGGEGEPRRLGVSLLRGAALGALMAALAVALAFVLDRASVRVTGDWSAWPGVALPLALGLVLAALGEELAFRGYPLRRLADAVGPVPAMVLLAALFGLAHSRNPNATLLSVVNVGLAAIWLSFAFFSSGGMALAWGAHFGWNAGLALLFDAPVSGYQFQVPVVEYTPGAHPWVDGGAFGPEGGIVSTIALVVGTLVIISRGGRLKQPALAA
ncbi:MAG TPA: CPBP family intramembrane glutamic endopeptidase [Gemmatimonadales bacterium]|nr:CPBP family intramembrane glutamic endopeptidase [Gemmatimonadales bacterium]